MKQSRMNPREAYVVQNPVGVQTINMVASLEEEDGTAVSSSKTHKEQTKDSEGTSDERGTLYVGVKNIRENPVDELDRVAGENLAAMNMQFQGLQKQYMSEYCKDVLVREADTLKQGDREMEKNHSTFQSYNAGGQASCAIKNAIASHDDVVKKEIERYAGNGSLLPEQYDTRATEAVSFVDRMRELDEQMKKAIKTNDSEYSACK